MMISQLKYFSSKRGETEECEWNRGGAIDHKIKRSKLQFEEKSLSVLL
jgi:hypothetical protein